MHGPDNSGWSQPLPPYTISGAQNAGPTYPPPVPPNYPMPMSAYPQPVQGPQIVVMQQQQQQQQQQQPQQQQPQTFVNIGPQSYLGWSIFTCLCLCWPIGIPALVFSTMVQEKWMRGDAHGALQSSIMARNLNIAGTTLGLVWIVAVCIAVPLYYRSIYYYYYNYNG